MEESVLFRYENKLQNIKAEIEDGGEVGIYLIIYDYGSDQAKFDYLQDNLETVFRQAERQFNISRDDWIKVNT
jgi:short-subunit dehydrogenase